MRFISLAWRNIRRNPRRTALTLIAFAAGVASLVFAWSMFDGSNAQMIGNMTGHYTGHIQIHRKGYTDNPNIDLAFSPQTVASLQLSNAPNATAIAPRTEALAMISSDNNSRGLLLVGIDPGAEPQVTTLHTKIVAGHYFNRNNPDEKGGILIGKSLAKVLAVTIGNEVAVLTQGAQGSIGAQRYQVQGIYDTQNDMIDSMQAFITQADADELLSLEGQVTSFVIKLRDRESTDAFVQQLRNRLGSDFDIQGWQELLPEVVQSVAFHESVGYVITLVLFGIVIIGVANAIMMSIMERLREFGVMMAMGTSATQVFRLILYEGVLLGLLGFAAGIAIGYALVSYFGATGIVFSKQAQALQTMQGVTNTIYPVLSWARMLYIATAVLIVIVCATLYPAWKAARLAPLQAIRGELSNTRGNTRSTHGGAGAITNRFLLPVLALRNLLRYPLRSSLTMFAIVFGLGAFVFVGSFANGYFTQMVENTTGMVTGDAQVQHKDFQRDMKPALSLPNGPQLLDRLRQIPSITAAAPRVQTTAMITSSVRSEPIMLIGIDPQTEQRVTFLHKAVKEGNYLQNGHNRDIVIGRKLAELLQAGVGERVVVMAQDANGHLVSEAFVIAGIFYTGGHGFDKAVVHIALPAAQNMLNIPGNITNIALRIPDNEQLAPTLQQIASTLPDDIKALPWQDLVPEVAQMSVVFKRSLTIVLAIVLSMVSVIVMNTVLMSVMERTREFGAMLALGSRPGLIVRLVMLEAIILGLLGAVAGLTLGGIITGLHIEQGINMTTHGVTAVPGVTNVIYPKWSAAVFAVPGILLPILVLLAAFYPALRASRLEPVKAMRHG